MIESLPELIKGDCFSDERGTLKFVNDFNFNGVKRFYCITQSKQAGARAWQGHKIETKYLFCMMGSFHIFLVKPDNWQSPSSKLEVKHFILTENESQVLKIPPGYANGFVTFDDQSSLLVFSDKTLEESKNDIYRFNVNKWINWNDYA